MKFLNYGPLHVKKTHFPQKIYTNRAKLINPAYKLHRRRQIFRLLDSPLPHVGSFLSTIRWQFLPIFDPFPPLSNCRSRLWTAPYWLILYCASGSSGFALALFRKEHITSL